MSPLPTLDCWIVGTKVLLLLIRYGQALLDNKGLILNVFCNYLRQRTEIPGPRTQVSLAYKRASFAEKLNFINYLWHFAFRMEREREVNPSSSAESFSFFSVVAFPNEIAVISTAKEGRLKRGT